MVSALIGTMKTLIGTSFLGERKGTQDWMDDLRVCLLTDGAEQDDFRPVRHRRRRCLAAVAG
jgi:hypothetical protein